MLLFHPVKPSVDGLLTRYAEMTQSAEEVGNYLTVARNIWRSMRSSPRTAHVGSRRWRLGGAH